MAIEQIQTARVELDARIADQRRRFFELHALVHREFERHNVHRIEDLPEEWQAVIEERGWDLLTPAQLGTELDRLDRELQSLAVVNELHRLYGLPDPRRG